MGQVLREKEVGAVGESGTAASSRKNAQYTPFLADEIAALKQRSSSARSCSDLLEEEPELGREGCH